MENNATTLDRRAVEARPVPPPARVLHAMPTDSHYAMICVGDCMLPEIVSETKLLFSSVDDWKVGDLVVIFKRPELVKPGETQALVKRLVVAPPPGMTFPFEPHPESECMPVIVAEQNNPRGRYYIPCDKIMGIHKCLGPVPPHIKTQMKPMVEEMA